MICLGLDIGGTRVKAALLRDGKVLAQHAGSSYSRPDRDVLVARVREAADALWNALPAATRADGLPGTGRRVDAVGISVPGVLADDRGRVVYAANVPGLVNLPLSHLAAAAAGAEDVAHVVATDQIAAATDYVGSRGARDGPIRGRVLAISIGTGVGAAVLDVDEAHPLGRPLRVNGDSPGHLGQIDVRLTDAPPTGPDGGAGTLEAYLGAPESYDAVTVKGLPDLYMKIVGGIHGDIATAAITVNSIPKVLTAPPGLQTMRSMPIPSWHGGKLK